MYHAHIVKLPHDTNDLSALSWECTSQAVPAEDHPQLRGTFALGSSCPTPPKADALPGVQFC